MTRNKRKPIPVGTISALDVTRAHMPKHNGWVCRGGPHGDTAYNRRKEKAKLKRILNEEGGHGRPPFLTLPSNGAPCDKRKAAARSPKCAMAGSVGTKALGCATVEA